MNEPEVVEILKRSIAKELWLLRYEEYVENWMADNAEKFAAVVEKQIEVNDKFNRVNRRRNLFDRRRKQCENSIRHSISPCSLQGPCPPNLREHSQEQPRSVEG